MASHSEYAGAIRGLSQTLGVAQGPIDASMARDCLVNGTRHLHDECGQVLLTLAKGAGDYWTPEAISTTQLGLLYQMPIPEFPVRRRGDTGNSFLVIVSAHVSISVAGTATFRVALHPGASTIDSRYPPILGGASVAEFTTTSTAGEVVEVDAIYFTGPMLDTARTGFPSKRGDGSMGTGNVFVGALSVWARSSAGEPRLHSITAREYVGA